MVYKKDPMETQTTPLRDKFFDQLKKTQKEIEELALQFSLGKAEAKDKFEEIKKDLTKSVRKWKEKYSGDLKNNHMKQMLDELELQLSLGKAEAIDKFDEQKKNILIAIQEMESEFKNNSKVKEYSENLKNDIEKFKLKMEILQLKFQAKKFDLKSNFTDEMNKATANLRSQINTNVNKANSKISDFSDEIDLAYKHFKKAIHSFGK
jgi:hypothetical protein